MDSQSGETKVIIQLQKLGLNAETLRSALRLTNGIIAGSFPVQCLLDETFPDSDIDIFVNIEYRRLYYNLFDKEYGIMLTYKLKYDEPDNEQYSGLSKIKQVLNFVCRDAHINLIFLSDKNPVDYVNNSFDLSFCKTYYDGDKLHFEKETLAKIGHICPVERHSNEYHLLQTMRRVSKYIKRGFIVYAKPPLLFKTDEELDNDNDNDNEKIQSISNLTLGGGNIN